MSASVISGRAEAAVHDVAPWLEKLARLGFLARAVLYMTIGALATTAALRLGGTPRGHEGVNGQRGAMGALLAAPAGRALLVVMAVGLFGYAAWCIVEAIWNPEGQRGAKGIAQRIRSGAVAAIHIGLGASAIEIAMGQRAASADGTATQTWTARALATSYGRLALWIVAAGLVVYGVQQLYAAWQAKLDKELSLGRLSSSTRRVVVAASRFGIAARGVVFATTGVLVTRAIQHHDPRHVRGIKASLGQLFELGRIPFAVIAVGLIAYGIYQLINARYRHIAMA